MADSSRRFLSTTLRELVDVRPSERRLLLAAVGFVILAVASAIVARSVSDALFLTAYPLDAVPGFFIVSAVMLILGSSLYSTLIRVVRPRPLAVGSIVALGLSMIAARLALPGQGQSAALYAVCAWLTVAPALLNILAWNIIADHLDSRQARRLVPIVFAGCTVGAILAGVSVGPFISVFGLENLILVLAGCALLAAPFPVLLDRLGSRSDLPGRSFIRERPESIWRILEEGVTTVARSRLLRSLALAVFLTAVVTNLVDFAFKGMLQASFGRDEIGTFYGYFNAATSTLNLFLQLFVVAWFLDRFGVARTLRVLPMTLLGGAILLGLFPLFATVVALKTADVVLRFTFQTSASEVALVPIDYVQRNRAKVFIKGAMNPLGALFAGVILMAFTGQEIPHRVLALALGVAIVAWLGVLSSIGRAHAEQLYVSLRRKQDRRTPAPEPSATFGRVIADTEPVSGERYPEDGLSDPSPIVRKNTLELVASRVRRDRDAKIAETLLEGLIWRELRLAFALLAYRERLGDLGSDLGRRGVELLAERTDDAIYRILLTVGIRTRRVEVVHSAWRGLRDETERTRAHALDLIDASLDGQPYLRALRLLLDELTLSQKLARARQLDLDDEVFVEPIEVIMAEHDPQLNRLLLAFD